MMDLDQALTIAMRELWCSWMDARRSPVLVACGELGRRRVDELKEAHDCLGSWLKEWRLGAPES